MLGANISRRQFTILVLLYTVGSSILIIPAAQAHFAKQDGWISTLIGSAFGFVLIGLYSSIGKLSPQTTLIGLNEKVLGKWLGTLVSVFLLTTLFWTGPAPVLYYVGDFLTTQIMPTTPIEAVNILFALTSVIGVRLGIDILARSAEVLLPWFFLLFFVLVLFLSPEIKPENFQPLLEMKVKPLWPAVLSFLSTAVFPSVIFLLFYPLVLNQASNGRKAFFKGYSYGVTILFFLVILCIAVLGPDITARSAYPSYALARKINLANFFQRIEAIMAFLWFLSLYFRLTLYLYAIAVGIAQIFRLPDYRPLVLPLGMLLVTYSLIVYPNAVYAELWDIHVWIPYTLTIGLFYPMLLLIGAKLRRKILSRGGNSAD